jgi:hypothetical protein
MHRMRIVGCIAVLVASVAATDDLAATTELAEPPRDPETGKCKYQGVIPVEGVNAHELYMRAKSWVAAADERARSEWENGGMGTSYEGLHLADAEEKRIVVEGGFFIKWMSNALGGGRTYLTHTLTIEAKDGRYRYRLTDFVGLGPWTARTPLETDAEFP